MNKIERVLAALQGNLPDRVPLSIWGHDYQREWSAADLATATLERYWKYNLDFIKVNPRATYYAEAWGNQYIPSADPHKGPECLTTAVKNSADWDKLTVLDPTEGVLNEHLQALQLIRDKLKDEAFFIQTVFSPLSVTKYLVGNSPEVILAHMKENPQNLHHALSVIAKTLAAYAQLCLECGAAGIFFATTGWASYDLLSEEQYREFGRPYDLIVLKAIQDKGVFNVLHNCGRNIMFDLLADYPVQAISWAATLAENPSLADGLRRMTKAAMGGIAEKITLKDGLPEVVKQEARQAIEQTAGRRFLLAPGCSVPTQTPEVNLWAMRRAVED
ncbi:MAG: hypothetical protein M1136_03325 [Chloroflexi bacterium]|nr:hypothetical protein [Chloroflexota bacterium]